MSTLQHRSTRCKRMPKRGEGCIAKTLTYEELDDSGFHDEEPPPITGDFLDVDFASPLTIPSPRRMRRITRSRRMSPVSVTLNFDDIDDEEEQQVPGICDLSPSGSPGSPPHRRLRALRLFDTPHTPKSLLQKAQRTKIREKKKATPECNKVEANTNPFTPVNQASGVKRSRLDMER